MKAEYSLPVKVKIEAENPDAVVVGLARAMHDAMELYLALNGTGQVDVEYAIYKKPDVDTFGRELCKQEEQHA